MGNFIYIDTMNPGYKEQMGEAVRDSIALAVSQTGNCKFTLTAPGFTRAQRAKQVKELEEQK